jgi:predicted amidohydrolase YtcJ
MVSPFENTLFKIPPFMDSHIHFMSDGKPLRIEEGPSLARTFLSRGIVEVNDMGHKQGQGENFKKTLAEGEAELFLNIRTAGQAVYKKGTYGGFLGRGVSGKNEIKIVIKELARQRVDYLKVINSGIVSLREHEPVTPGGFSREEWKIIAEEAGCHGLRIRCHANGDPAIQQALSFGVSTIEHGFFISEDTLDQMAEKGVSWTPTAQALMTLKSFCSANEHAFIEKIVDNHLKAVYDGISKGIVLKIGTDSGSKGVRTGESFFKELQLFKSAGLSWEQLLAAATLGWQELKKGNYLLVRKDFIEREKIEAFYFGGRKMDLGPAPSC